jgi:hypothetical protein
MKMTFNVGAALLRGDLPVSSGRRSEIGSHIFIGSGAPNGRMCKYYENAVWVATLTAFSREAWAFDGQKDPRLAATAVAYALTVATPTIFMGGGAPNWCMDNSCETISSRPHSSLVG